MGQPRVLWEGPLRNWMGEKHDHDRLRVVRNADEDLSVEITFLDDWMNNPVWLDVEDLGLGERLEAPITVDRDTLLDVAYTFAHAMLEIVGIKLAPVPPSDVPPPEATS